MEQTQSWTFMPLTGSGVGLSATWGPWQMARAKEPSSVVKHLKCTQKFNSSFKIFLFVTDSLLWSCCCFLQHVLAPHRGSGAVRGLSVALCGLCCLSPSPDEEDPPSRPILPFPILYHWRRDAFCLTFLSGEEIPCISALSLFTPWITPLLCFPQKISSTH